MQSLLLVSLSGLLGIWLRYFLSIAFEKVFLPASAGTLFINFVGSLAAGMVFALSSEKSLVSQTTALILLVGFCGGFTTFSAYSLQNYQLISHGEYRQVLVYLIGSPVLGLLATYLGIVVIRQLL